MPAAVVRAAAAGLHAAAARGGVLRAPVPLRTSTSRSGPIVNAICFVRAYQKATADYDNYSFALFLI